MKRVLFIWFKHYDSILEGGGLANMRNYTTAQQIFGEKNVDSYYIHQDGERISLLHKIRSAFLFLFSYHNGLTPQKVREIVSLANNYDYIFLNTTVFGLIAKRLKEAGYQGRIIAHFHNIESQYYDCLLPKHMPFRRAIIHSAYRNDGYCCQYADRIISLNERDSKLLHQMYGRSADAIIPITLPDRYAHGMPDKEQLTNKRPTCMFLGSNFTANAEGVLWFVREVLPHVDIQFKVVGKGMASLQQQHVCLKDIEIISDVPSLTPYLEETDFMILPIFSGSGMKVKTCEALMYGKNILGTDETFEGYELDDQQVGARCNTASEYIEAIQHFSNHPIPRFNQYCREIYLAKYSPNVAIKYYKTIFES